MSMDPFTVYPAHEAILPISSGDQGFGDGTYCWIPSDGALMGMCVSGSGWATGVLTPTPLLAPSPSLLGPAPAWEALCSLHQACKEPHGPDLAQGCRWVWSISFSLNYISQPLASSNTDTIHIFIVFLEFPEKDVNLTSVGIFLPPRYCLHNNVN